MRRLTKTSNLTKTRREIEDTFATKGRHVFTKLVDKALLSEGERAIYQDANDNAFFVTRIKNTIYYDALYSDIDTAGSAITDLTGDVVAAGPGAVPATIPNNSVTYAKIQDVSATDKVLGRASAGAGDVEEITCTAFARSILDDANEATFKATVNLEIGVDVQAYDATLQSISLLGTAADRLAYTTGVDTWAEGILTVFGRSLIDDVDAAAARTTLALGTIATQNANAVAITGGVITGITDLAVADGGTGASTLTGILVGNGINPFTAITTSAGLAGQISDETGTGALVFGTSPTFTTQITTPVIYGGVAANDDITIEGTSHATKTTSYVILQPTAGNVGIGTTGPNYKLQVKAATNQNFIVSSNIGGATGAVTIGTVNDANSLNVPLEFRATSYAFNVGNVGIGTTGPTALLDINSDILRLRTAKTPATSGAAGNQGDFCWDADYLYICIATNTWRRVAHATW